MPGTRVATGDADTTGVGLVSFAATEYYYDQFNDGTYLGGDLVAHNKDITKGLGIMPPVPDLGLDGARRHLAGLVDAQVHRLGLVRVQLQRHLLQVEDAKVLAVAVAVKVFVGTITSSPGFSFMASSAR
jgi:hypothetical protein